MHSGAYWEAFFAWAGLLPCLHPRMATWQLVAMLLAVLLIFGFAVLRLCQPAHLRLFHPDLCPHPEYRPPLRHTHNAGGKPRPVPSPVPKAQRVGGAAAYKRRWRYRFVQCGEMRKQYWTHSNLPRRFWLRLNTHARFAVWRLWRYKWMPRTCAYEFDTDLTVEVRCSIVLLDWLSRRRFRVDVPVISTP